MNNPFRSKPKPILEDDPFFILLKALIPAIQNARPIKASIPEPMFRKLLMLCHPDKHNNSETATEVTRWLIAERNKAK